MEVVLSKHRERLESLKPYYESFRWGGKRAIDAYKEAKKYSDEAKKPASEHNIFQSLLPIVYATVIMMGALKWIGGYIRDGLWITSKSGKTTKQLPLKLALRVMRKRGWVMARVEPVKPKRKISRLEALRILLVGDR